MAIFMNSRFQPPDRDDESRRDDDDDVDLRFRAYEWEVEDEEDVERPTRRVADGWSTETDSEMAWWVKAGIAIVSILIVVSLVAGLAGPFLGSFGSDEPTRIQYVPARVLEVLDVRTIIVEIDGERATVRYIGVEPLPLDSLWYDIGILANQQLVAGKEVLLEADEVDSDDFGRLLRYVYADQNMVNGLLVRNGIALSSGRTEGLDRHYPNLQGWSEAAQIEKLGHFSGIAPQFSRNEGVN